MSQGRKYVGFNMDAGSALAANAFLMQISHQMRTPAHIGPVLKYAHAELSQEFDAHMSSLAPSAPSQFHHIYEWNRIGDPTAQLWKNVLKGGGNNRTATFEWRASKTIVPVNENLPTVNSYGQDISEEEMPKAIHVFVWKAPIMEYGQSTHVSPQRGEYIVYYTGEWTTNHEYYQKLWFTKNAITIRDPGGKHVQGAFTAAYVEWWSGGGAQAAFSRRLERIMGKNTKAMVREGLASINSRSRSRSFNMNVMNNPSAAESAGKAAAKAAMARLEGNYIEAAKQREAFMP